MKGKDIHIAYNDLVHLLVFICQYRLGAIFKVLAMPLSVDIFTSLGEGVTGKKFKNTQT